MKHKIILIANFFDGTTEGIGLIVGNKEGAFFKKYLFDVQREDYGSTFKARITVENPYLFLSEDKVERNYFDDWEVLLVSDTLETTIYPQDKLFGSDTLVMYHSTPNNIEKFLEEEVNTKKNKRGYHELGDQNGYPLINYLIDAYEGTKFDGQKYDEAIKRIIDWFGVGDAFDELEEKLDLLHKCLCPENVPENLNSFKLLSKYKKSFETFQKERNDKAWNENEYRKALKRLRNVLLPECAT